MPWIPILADFHVKAFHYGYLCMGDAMVGQPKIKLVRALPQDLNKETLNGSKEGGLGSPVFHGRESLLSGQAS